MQTILLIEDEKDLADLIAINLETESYRAMMAHDGVSGLEMARKQHPDLILLDQMLPGMLGTDVCKELKRVDTTAAIPVVIVSAKGEEIDKVVGFEAGADDYVVKPFSIRELMLRIRGILRHSVTDNDCGVSRVGELAIDQARHTASVKGADVVLTAMEFKLLHMLVKRVGTVQSREDLMRAVWGCHQVVDTRTVDTHVTRIRTKLGTAGEMIKTVRGFGYLLDPG